ncbi:MAG: DUF2282 domain-containing protein [Pseudomonadota bacterium]|nr:MAG: DUF2282 domain-containing protein [Pseudomonadota bacterium]
MRRPSQAIFLSSIIGGVLALAGQAQGADLVQCAAQERCYGVTKAGKNDCSTSTSACVGTAKQDFQKDAWIYVPKGTCLRLAGGSLSATPPTAKP